MKKSFTYSLIFCGTLFYNTSYSQETDSLKTERVKHLSKDLALPETKAQEVVAIMDDYKNAAKGLSSESNLNESQLRIKFDALIEEKNKKLRKVLTEGQLKKFLPTTEFKPKG